MSTTHYDAIVIGAGHNGLCNAAFLARAGLRVVVLERGDPAGATAAGGARDVDATYADCSQICGLPPPEIQRALDLARHGLQVLPAGGGATLLADGGIFARPLDPVARQREIARHSRADADAWPRFLRDVTRQCRFVRALQLRTPPDPLSARPRDLAELLFLYRRLYDLGEAVINDILRFHTLSVAEWLGDYFASEVVQADLAGRAILGSGLGVYSPGTASGLLRHDALGEVETRPGTRGRARGGPTAVMRAFAGALRASGGEIRTRAGVAEVRLRGARAVGVTLENGLPLSADTIVSDLDPRRTFLELVPREALTERFREAVQRHRMPAAVAALELVLDGLPRFPAAGADHAALRGHLQCLDSLPRLERAYDDWKYGGWSRDPCLDVVIPSLTDPTLAPPGRHVMSILVQYAPQTPQTPRFQGAWSEAAREALAEDVLAQVARSSPDLRERLLHVAVRTPSELTATLGMTGSSLLQGELTLDQRGFNRPVPGWARYRTPVPGLYLCGAATHPGGAVMGASGANAAREILRDLRRRPTVPTATETAG